MCSKIADDLKHPGPWAPGPRFPRPWALGPMILGSSAPGLGPWAPGPRVLGRRVPGPWAPGPSLLLDLGLWDLGLRDLGSRDLGLWDPASLLHCWFFCGLCVSVAAFCSFLLLACFCCPYVTFVAVLSCPFVTWTATLDFEGMQNERSRLPGFKLGFADS